MQASSDKKGLQEILKSVSRSFYLSMVFLPKQMRAPISLAYMLARATDSVADSSQADIALRLSSLRQMGQAIEGELTGRELSPLLESLQGELAQAQAKASEALLLQRFGDCLQLLQSRPEGEQVLIRRVLHTIIEGQCWDLEFFEQHDCVQNNKQTQDYTYMVAGCVGEFWTDLGHLCMGKGKFCPEDKLKDMREAGNRYGCGLQLVNILRDRAEDTANGRSYLCSAPSRWQARAAKYLQDGVDYSLRLANVRLRFTALLPALLGLKTLKLIHEAGDATSRQKITRSTVYITMVQALMMSLFSAR
ncbi:MAG: squalene/phytoene synthase family protein [Akkermansia sp.]